MEKGQIQIEKCLKDHIKDYEFKMLLPVETIKTFLDTLSSVISCSISLTERHGEIIYTNKITSNSRIEVEENPGLKIQIEGRTIAHFYYEINNNDEKKTEIANIVITEYVEQLKILATIQYQKKEWEKYAETLEDILQRERKRNILAEKEDALTGVFNHSYFKHRSKVIDRSGIIPVAVIVGNINDWKHVYDQYGVEESDKLIKRIASIVKEEAKPEYVIGRIDGDSFHIIIPMAEKEEVKEYITAVKKRCFEIVDEKFFPSIAFGYEIKTNIEENIQSLLSDAEYKMFEDKYEMKHAKHYRK